MRAGTGTRRGRRWRMGAWTAAVLPLAALPLAVPAAAGQARAAATPPDCLPSGTMVTCTYTAAGTFTVPGRVRSIHVIAVGGHGASGGDTGGHSRAGGPGAQVTANLAVTPGEVLAVETDAGGGTGGSANPNYFGGDGGGKSAVGTAHDPSLVVAGGGGGGGGFSEGGAGGAAGGADPGTCRPGTDGHNGTVSASGHGGAGGGCASGGAYGPAGYKGGPGTAGTAASGGTGGDVGADGGGGGGAGYFGGGGGGSSGVFGGGGGGGGSSFGPAGSVFATAETGPRVVISYQAQHVITIDKIAEPATFTAAGDVIRYLYTVTNTGHVTLHDITVHDSVIGHVPCPATTLGPGESMRCTARYTITRQDVERGSITNAVLVTGLDPNDQPQTDQTTATDTLAAVPVPVTG